MVNRISNLLFRIKNYKYLKINDTVSQKILEYRYANDKSEPKKISDYGFSIYSQHEEDGILLYIFSLIGVQSKKCVEICAGNGVESNTANLFVNHFWTGLLFDGNVKNIEFAKKFYSMHKNTKIYPPIIKHAWINKDNINTLIEDNGIKGEIDLFSLDIDGNDYYLLDELNVINPRVIVLEINHMLGYEKSLSIPYDEKFVAEFKNGVTDYYGASLMAFIKLANSKGYRFVGLNRIATNAFFIRNDITHDRLPEVKKYSEYFKHPRAKFGMSVRGKKIINKEWVKV